MAERIPGAGLVELPGIDHSFTMGEWEPVVDEIEQFLTPPERQVDRVLATVLFTDIVGSTARAVDPGDHRWRELLAAHNALIRQALQRFGGREVNTTGDGFLATSPARVAPSNAPARCMRAFDNSDSRSASGCTPGNANSWVRT
jgi:class 3 adenylate cyclase